MAAKTVTSFLALASFTLGSILVAGTVTAATPKQTAAALKHANELLSKHPLIDGHNDLPYVIREQAKPPRNLDGFDLNVHAHGDTDIPRLRAGRVGGQFWSAWVPSSPEVVKAGAARYQLEQIDIALRMIEKYPNDLRLALTADDIEQANRDGRIASLLGMEGGHTLENSLGALRTYYRLGVRYMTLTHFNHTEWADAATQKPVHGGLTAFGKEVVREMNRLGMLVDLSHVSEDTMNDALDATEAPVIFSHSSARAVTPHVRNVPDAVLKRMAANGGVVMATFVSDFTIQGKAFAKWQSDFNKVHGDLQLSDAKFAEVKREFIARNPKPRSTVKDVANHVEHIRNVAGIDHLGIGGDLFGAPLEIAAGLDEASGYPALFAELILRGWKDEDLVKVARGNILRTLRGMEQVAAKLAARPASFLTIEQLDRGQEKPNAY